MLPSLTTFALFINFSTKEEPSEAIHPVCIDIKLAIGKAMNDTSTCQWGWQKKEDII